MSKSGTLSLLLLLSCLLSGCWGTGENKSVLQKMKDGDSAQIKVMFYDEQSFFQQYGSLFQSKHPNVEIEVSLIPNFYGGISENPQQALDNYLANNRPDVLMLNEEQYKDLAAAGKLFPLDEVIRQDRFDLNGVHPAVLQQLRDKGNGKLFGLSPTFASAALFYNKDLFRQFGVELPRDSMTWEEVFKLAKRFPSAGEPDNRIYGFSAAPYSSLDGFLNMVGSAEGLRMVSADGKRVTVHTDGWKKVYGITIDALQSKAIYYSNTDTGTADFSSPPRNLFLEGRSAMTVDYQYLVNQIHQDKDASGMPKHLNWGIVTAPVDPNNRNQSSYFTLGSIFCVNASSPNPRAAWELVKYINSEDYARLKAKAATGELMSHSDYIADVDGVSMQPFYKLDPRPLSTPLIEVVPPGFVSAFIAVLTAEVENVLAGKKTLDAALSAIEKEGQTALDDYFKK